MQKDYAEVAKIPALFQLQARGPESTGCFSPRDRMTPNLGGWKKTLSAFLTAFLRAVAEWASLITYSPKGLLE